MIICHDEQIHCQINDNDFFDNRLLGVFEIAVASNILYKLGNPIINFEIRIIINGFLESSLISELEDFLEKSICFRTSVRFNCITPIVPVHIVVASSTPYPMDTRGERKANECFLLFSKGLDSLVSEYLLQQKFIVRRITFPDDYCFWEEINKMYIDTFDNDPWDDYGLYFIFLSLLLNKAVTTGVANISIGLNHDDLHGYDIISNLKIYSQCCQSEDFIALFRDISSYYNVSVVLPLELQSRTDICKIIIRNSLDVTNSISCVFYDEAECGMCFSCFDKITGFLVAIAELNEIHNLDLRFLGGLYYLQYKQHVIMSFKNDCKKLNSLEQLPIDYIMRTQINRIIYNEDLDIVFSSKYSVINTIKTLKYYSFHRIGHILFPQASKIFIQYQNDYNNKICEALEYYHNVHS